MRGEQIEITINEETQTLPDILEGLQNAAVTDWDLDNDNRVDKAYALSTPPHDHRPITWNVRDLDRELKRLANRAIGIAVAL